MRQASGDLFPTDVPIPASQLIGRADDVREVATALEAGGEIGEGSVHRVARVVQRRYFDPPELPNASAPRHGARA